MAEIPEDVIPLIEELTDNIILLKEKADKASRAKSGVLGQLFSDKKEPKRELPDYYPGYKLAADWLTQIRPHAEKGFFPAWLFENNSPNMTDPEKEYVRANFRQDTLEVFKDTVDTMGRAYHDGNYNITWLAENDQYISKNLTLKEYLTEQLPVYNSIETFCFEFLPPLKLMDAEGVVAVLPGEIFTAEIEGEIVIDPEKLLEPYPEFYHCTKVLHFSDRLAILESSLRSDVEFNGKTVREGFVFWVLTDQWYYQVRQKGKKVDNDFDIVNVWEHGLGWVPAIKTGGITIQIDDIIMEQSPFLYAVDTLDRVLIDSTLLAGAMTNCCYPYRVMIGDPCEAVMKVDGENRQCDNGYFRFHDGTSLQCTTCHGTGLKDRVTPTGMMLLKPRVGNQEGDSIKPSEALFYASPDTATLEFTAKRIDYNFVKAYNLLHLKRDNSKIQGGEEVTATEIDDEHKALIASITTNSKQNFEILRFLVKTLGTIRYGENLKLPTIKEPVSFDFFTVDEFIDRIAKLASSGAPSVFIQTEIRDSAARIFFKDIESRKKFDLILRTNRLISMTEADINIKQSKRLIDGWEIILNDSAMMFIDQLIEENPKFFEQPILTQKEQLIQKAKNFAASITPIQSPAIKSAQDRLNGILQNA